MNVLLLGSGGRESAFAWKLSQSPLCKQLFIAPGNGGTQQFGTNIPLDILDFDSLKEFCVRVKIDLVIPGGEDSLVKGIYDYFQRDPLLNKIQVAGPSQMGAQLEGSKAFAKEFMQRHHIPTANYREFSEENYEEGLAYLEQHSLPIVLKADGLAAGKGVVITSDISEAKDTFTSMIKDSVFGSAGHKVVIEEFLTGIELSVFALSDGDHFVVLPEAKDYKRIGEGETGLNTGGMGAISPVPFADKEFMNKVRMQVIEPTIRGLKQENIDYKGFIFFGLISVSGEPFVIEYNCRMGDPETEAVLPRLKDDLMELFLKMKSGNLNNVQLTFSSQSAATVMMVSGGYPGSYKKGKEIKNIEETENSLVFQAGTQQIEDIIQTAGGRVLAITTLADTLQNALKQSYANAERIQFEGKYFRKDIGFEFIKKEIES